MILRRQLIVVPKPRLHLSHQNVDEVALFNSDGTPYGSSSVGTVTAHVTSDELKDLIANPIVLAPALEDQRYAVNSWHLRFHAGEIPYSYADSGPPWTILMVGPQDIVAGNESYWELFGSSLGELVSASSDFSTQFLPAAGIGENLVGGHGLGEPLVFGNAGTVDLSDGDGALDVAVQYSIVDF